MKCLGIEFLSHFFKQLVSQVKHLKIILNVQKTASNSWKPKEWSPWQCSSSTQDWSGLSGFVSLKIFAVSKSYVPTCLFHYKNGESSNPNTPYFTRKFKFPAIYPFCIKFTSNLASNTTRILTIGMIVTGCGQVIGSIFVAIIGNKIRKFGQHVLILGALILHVILFLMISLSFPNDAPLHHTDGNGPVFPLRFCFSLELTCNLLSFQCLLGYGNFCTFGFRWRNFADPDLLVYRQILSER